MRKIISCIAIILAATLFLCGCSFSWDEEDAVRSIKEIKRITDSEGNVYLEISYTDNTDSNRFLIPKGVSVEEVTSEYDEEKRATVVTLKYTDGNEPVVFEIPDGRDAATVKRVEFQDRAESLDSKDYLIFIFAGSDGIELDPPIRVDVSALRGKNGADGATWLFGEVVPSDDSGKNGDFYLDTVLFMVYRKEAGTWVPCGSIKGNGIFKVEPFYEANDDGTLKSGMKIIMTEKPEEGDSEEDIYIDDAGEPHKSYKVYSSALTNMSVTYNAQTGMYEFVLYVTDVFGNTVALGTTDADKIMVQRPAAWFSGNVPPASFGEVTFDGDFYFFTPYKQIWHKENGAWRLIADLSTYEGTCTVTFDANGGENPDYGTYPIGVKGADGNITVPVNKNEYFGTKLPTPTREGYKFVGWYSVKLVEFDASGDVQGYTPFNEWVPVNKDVTLYAIWFPIE